MSGTLEPLHHDLSCSRRYCTAGYDIPRPVLLPMPQFASLLGSSNAALMLATKLIILSTSLIVARTGSQLLTDTAALPTYPIAPAYHIAMVPHVRNEGRPTYPAPISRVLSPEAFRRRLQYVPPRRDPTAAT